MNHPIFILLFRCGGRILGLSTESALVEYAELQNQISYVK